MQEDHLIKELCEAAARGATYLHPLLLWVGGASFPATLCKNGLFLCFMLLAYSIHIEGILKLYCSHTEGLAGFPFSVLLSSLSVALRRKRTIAVESIPN